jgi:hypothetical protein
MSGSSVDSRQFRVWITRYEKWRPRSVRDRPPSAVAVEPAEPGTMSAREARAYAAAFNESALAARCKLWAVILPVVVRYEKDAQPGQVLGRRRA